MAPSDYGKRKENYNKEEFTQNEGKRKRRIIRKEREKRRNMMRRKKKKRKKKRKKNRRESHRERLCYTNEDKHTVIDTCRGILLEVKSDYTENKNNIG